MHRPTKHFGSMSLQVTLVSPSAEAATLQFCSSKTVTDCRSPAAETVQVSAALWMRARTTSSSMGSTTEVYEWNSTRWADRRPRYGEFCGPAAVEPVQRGTEYTFVDSTNGSGNDLDAAACQAGFLGGATDKLFIFELRGGSSTRDLRPDPATLLLCDDCFADPTCSDAAGQPSLDQQLPIGTYILGVDGQDLRTTVISPLTLRSNNSMIRTEYRRDVVKVSLTSITFLFLVCCMESPKRLHHTTQLRSATLWRTSKK